MICLSLAKSIKHVAGDITRRKSGGPVTDLVVKALHQEGRAIRDRYNYKTTTSDGRVLKSTTIFIRDSKGNVAFALCINFDMTDFLNTSYALEIFTSVAGAFNDQEKVETFAMTITETFRSFIQSGRSKNRKTARFNVHGRKD